MSVTNKTIYVKLTNNCNLKCAHCYNSVCTDSKQMTAETLEKILLYIADLKEQGYTVDVALHGGEPTLYSDIDALQDFVYSCNEMQVPITMTTNLVYDINEDWLALFKRLKQDDGEPLVLTSWDYKIRFKHNMQEQMWETSVKKLLDEGIIVQPIVSLTKVLLEKKTPKSIFEYMDKLGVKRLNFERLTCTGRAEDNEEDLMPNNQQVDTWVAEAYKTWKNSYSYMYIPLLDALEWAAYEGKYIGCRARECTKSVRTFNPDGSMATCPNIPLEIVGNITNTETMEVGDTIIGNNKYKELCNKESIKNNECYTCEYYSICNGDCFQLRWDYSGCPGLKKTIREVMKNTGD